MSLEKFVYKNSPLCYNQKGSTNYFNFGHPTDGFTTEVARLRQSRHRLLLDRSVYNETIEGSAIPMSSEHEWKFYYKLEASEEDIRDTFKRIGNLHNKMNKYFSSTQKEPQPDCVISDYEKFLSKLKKIKYENFINLHKAILDHICEDSTYYGINLYRFEKRLGFFKITNEVNQLLKCKSEEDQIRFLCKTILLKEIYFPKVYHDFVTLDAEWYIKILVKTFPVFLEQVTLLGRLIIDEMVEKGVFGKDWNRFFLNTINSMTEQVFYLPSQINYTIEAESQMYFEEVRVAPVHGVDFYS